MTCPCDDHEFEPVPPRDCFLALEADLLDFVDSQNIEHTDDLARIEKALKLYQHVRHLRRDLDCDQGEHHGCYCNIVEPPVPQVPATGDKQA